MNRSKTGAVVKWTTVIAAVLLTAPAAFAQDTAAQPRPVAPVMVGGSDHDMVVGHVGFGWFGTRDIPVGPVGVAAPLSTPVVGVRYWLTPMIGLDGGLGVFATSGSTTVTPPAAAAVDPPSRTTFALRAGLPLALAGSNHFSFQVTPEIDVGFGSGTNRGVAPAPNTDLTGFLLQVGARVGAEIYFGFIGIPQLSLDASVGLFLSSTTGKTTTGGASTKISNLTIATSSVAQPWDIFRKDLAARYYF